MTRYDGTVVLNNFPLEIPARGIVDYDMCSNDSADNYGVSVLTPENKGTIESKAIREGQNDRYVFPTLVRQ